MAQYKIKLRRKVMVPHYQEAEVIVENLFGLSELDLTEMAEWESVDDPHPTEGEEEYKDTKVLSVERVEQIKGYTQDVNDITGYPKKYF